MYINQCKIHFLYIPIEKKVNFLLITSTFPFFYSSKRAFLWGRAILESNISTIICHYFSWQNQMPVFTGVILDNQSI